jgi:hypothetical protein
VAHLLEEAERDPELVVGLDFAFSLPEWFLRTRGIDDVSNAWDLVSREAEAWLRDPQPPFWRTRKPPGQVAFRRTELECGGRPKSVFQLVGAGQVGTGTLRGIPFLPWLRERFSIWPFDEPPAAPRRDLPTPLRERWFVPERARSRRSGECARDEPLGGRLAPAPTRSRVRPRGPDLARRARPRRRLDSTR